MNPVINVIKTWALIQYNQFQTLSYSSPNNSLMTSVNKLFERILFKFESKHGKIVLWMSLIMCHSVDLLQFCKINMSVFTSVKNL